MRIYLKELKGKKYQNYNKSQQWSDFAWCQGGQGRDAAGTQACLLYVVTPGWRMKRDAAGAGVHLLPDSIEFILTESGASAIPSKCFLPLSHWHRSERSFYNSRRNWNSSSTTDNSKAMISLLFHLIRRPEYVWVWPLGPSNGASARKDLSKSHH